MGGDYGSDFVTIADEDGNEYVLEHLSTIEVGKDEYMAFLPADLPEDDDEYGISILKVVEENGEELLAAIEDESELERVYELFMEQLQDDEE